MNLLQLAEHVGALDAILTGETLEAQIYAIAEKMVAEPISALAWLHIYNNHPAAPRTSQCPTRFEAHEYSLALRTWAFEVVISVLRDEFLVHELSTYEAP